MWEKNKPELLSPAGSMESLKAAVNNGCDAVYLGGRLFSARQYAGNFSAEELEEACDYCHLRGVKVYVTVNTLCKDDELKELLSFIGKLYAMGVDALIVQDIGGAELIKKYFPELPIHASTQMTANSLSDVQYMEGFGFSKIVLSRELSLEEIKIISENSQAETEVFIHGALCVCYSGRCIMSSMLGGRSGNRGRCAQPCRLPYTLYHRADKVEEGYLLSPKDIETIKILPEIIKAGVNSLKIEGRMKSPEYVAGVTRVYRKYIDMYFDDPENYGVSSEDIKILTQLFNRGGFTEGYFTSPGGRSMISVERPKSWGLKVGIVDDYIPKYHRLTIRTREALLPGDGIEVWTENEPHVGTGITKTSRAGEVIALSLEGDIKKNDVVYRTYGKALNDSLRKTWEKDTRKKSISGSFKGKKGQPMTLQLWDMSGNIVYVTGETVLEAEKQPVSPLKIEQQLKKTGATPFVIENLETDTDEDIYISVSALNELRRKATDALEKTIIKRSKRNINEDIKRDNNKNKPNILKKKLRVLVRDILQLEAVASVDGIDGIYYETSAEMENSLEKAIKLCHDEGIKLFAALPSIGGEWKAAKDRERADRLKKSSIDGFLVRSWGQLQAVRDSSKEIALDHCFNIFNEESVEHCFREGAATVCLSLEANLQEINSMGNKDCEMVVYGYLPLMRTRQCPIGNFAGERDGHIFCNKKDSTELYFLKDRKNMKFPLMTDCESCVCTILNSKPLFTLKFYDEILESVTGYVRLEFTKEGPGRVERMVRAYVQMTKNPHAKTPLVEGILEEMSDKGSTKGHFFRGVE